MSSTSTLRSGAFRLALFFAAVFAVGAIALVVATGFAVSRYAVEVTTHTLVNEARRLQIEDEREGRRATIEAIRNGAGDTRRFHYLLIDAQRRRVAGDLPMAPIGWGRARMSERSQPGDRPDAASDMRTYGVLLGDGSHLVVGSDSYDVEELRDWLNTVALWSGIGVTFLALGAGYLIAAIFVRRLDRINAAAHRVMEGRLSERMPAMGMGPEFDQLSGNLNDYRLAPVGSLREAEAILTGAV
jgi:HAMP domain-containing protein